jgi:hypothetical protein
MCGGPDVMAEYEALDRVVLAAFWAYKDCMQRLYDTGEEGDTDWVKAFCDGFASRLRLLEKEGKLRESSEGHMP